MSRTSRALTILLCLSATPLFGQVVETFPVDFGPPRFREQPWIRGNLVVWKRFGAGDNPGTGFIQCKDISRLDGPVINVAPHRGDAGGVFLGRTDLFFWRSPNVVSRPLETIEEGLEGDSKPVSVGGGGTSQIVVGSTLQHTFIRTGSAGGGSYFARRHEDFGPSPRPGGTLDTATRSAHFGFIRRDPRKGALYLKQG